MNKSALTMVVVLGLACTGVFAEDLGGGTKQATCTTGLWSAAWEVQAHGAFGGHDLVADGEQNVYAIGEDDTHDPPGALVVKYDKDGTELWRRVYTEGDGQVSAQAIEFDKDGNVVVTGYAYATGRVVTLSYTSKGGLRWVNGFSSATYPYLGTTDLSTDNKGNSYVTGYATPSGANDSFDIFLIKVDKKGKLAWSRFYNGTSNHLDFATDVRADDKGNVFIGGGTEAGAFQRDFLTLKYRENGSLAWARTYNGPDNLSDEISDIEVNNKGDVVVAGSSYTGRTVLRYDTNGNQKWSRHEAGPYNTEHSLALDREEAAVITSSIDTFDGVEVTRYDKNGNTQWARSYLQATTIERDVQIDANQNVYVLGSLLGDGSEIPSALVLVYDKNGNQLYSDARPFSNRDIIVRELALSCGGAFYYSAWDDFGQSDVITVRYEACADNHLVKACGKSSDGLAVVEPDPSTEPWTPVTINPRERGSARDYSPAK